jgi:hypothetical protein
MGARADRFAVYLGVDGLADNREILLGQRDIGPDPGPEILGSWCWGSQPSTQQNEKNSGNFDFAWHQ